MEVICEDSLGFDENPFNFSFQSLMPDFPRRSSIKTWKKNSPLISRLTLQDLHQIWLKAG